MGEGVKKLEFAPSPSPLPAGERVNLLKLKRNSPPLTGEGVKKSICFLFTSFRRKPESSFFNGLAIYWTPVFTGATAKIQFFHTFGEG